MSGANAAPSLRARLAVALLAGALAAAFATAVAATRVDHPSPASADYDHLWFAARMLAQGVDPYVVIGPGRAWEYPYPLLYPLSAVVGLAPLALVPLTVARAVFVGGGVALLAWALSARAWWPLVWLVSAPIGVSVQLSQWSPLLLAAGMLPAAGWLLACKPQAAVQWVAITLSPRLLRTIIVAGVALGALALVVDPDWPVVWLGIVRGVHHMRPNAAWPLAWPLALAALRWRDPGARALLTCLLMPSNVVVYEWAALAVVPRTRAQMMALTLCSIAAVLKPVYDAGASLGLGPREVIAVVLGYPALAMVLTRRAGEALDDRGSGSGSGPGGTSASISTRPGRAPVGVCTAMRTEAPSASAAAATARATASES